jgi:hypothetical protein
LSCGSECKNTFSASPCSSLTGEQVLNHDLLTQKATSLKTI